MTKPKPRIEKMRGRSWAIRFGERTIILCRSFDEAVRDWPYWQILVERRS